MNPYLGSVVQFSPAIGRAGCCRQISLCVDSTHHVPATLGLPRTGGSVVSPSTLRRLPAALYGAGPALSAVPVFGYSTKARIRLRPRVVSSPASAVQAAKGLCAFSRVRRAFSLHSERLRQPEACGPLPGGSAPFPSTTCGSGSQRLVRPLPGCGAPFPSAAPTRAAGRVSGSL